MILGLQMGWEENRMVVRIAQTTITETGNISEINIFLIFYRLHFHQLIKI
jgi:hypothetical protein